MNEPLVRTLSTQISPKTRRLGAAIGVGLVALWAVWTGVHLFHNHTHAQQTAAATPPPPPAVSPPAAVENPKASTPAPLPAVVHQEMPDLSHRARESIRGIIKIAVRVSVDRSGNVVAAALDGRASSKYFSRAATDAAKKWKFSPAADPASRAWLLHFELTRGGTTARADALH
jgi:TonB family protein